MTNETNTTATNSLVHNMLTEALSAEIGLAIRENSIMYPLMKVMSLEGVPSKAGAFQYAGGMSAAGGTEASAYSNTLYTLNNAQATAAEVGISVIASRLGIESTMANMDIEIAKDAVGGVVEKFETDACALLANFSNTVGTTTVNITFAHMISALATLRINAKGKAQRAAFVLYPQQIADLQTAALAGSGAALSLPLAQEHVANLFGSTPSSMVMSNMAGSFFGVPVFSSQLVPSANTGADSGGALLCAGEALGCVWKYGPSVKAVDAAPDSISGTRYLVVAAYGVVEIADSLGVSIITDR